METGKITVDGIELVQGDLAVSRYVEVPASDQAKYSANTDNDVVVILDIDVHPELLAEGLAREMINRVQKLRKTAGLQPTDDVDVFYKFESETDAEDLKQAMTVHEEMIRGTLKSSPKHVGELSAGTKVLIEAEQEIAEVRFSLSLVKLS